MATSYTNFLTMPLLAAGQAGHAPHNDAIIVMDMIVGGGVKSAIKVAPGSPANWDMHIVAGTPAGGDAWYGHPNTIAYRYNNAWKFLAPKNGLRVWNRNDNCMWLFDGTSWIVCAPASAIASNSADRDTASATWAGLSMDTDVVVPSNAFTRGAATGEFICNTGGLYSIEISGGFKNTSSLLTSLELGAQISGGTGGTTPDTNSVRRHTFNLATTILDNQMVLFRYIATVTAGQYVRALFRNYGTAGTAVGTIRLNANTGNLMITKLNP